MPAALPERFRDVTERRDEGARVVDAVDGQRRVRLVIVEARSPSAVDVGATLARANRFALGVAGLVLARECVELEGACALVYDPPPGVSLSDLRMHGLSHERALSVLDAVAQTLSALHAQGIAHGQVTDASIVVNDDRVALIGYGVADVAHAVGGPAVVRDALPPRYRAPEQQGLAPAKHETWSDVFAFGVLAEEVLGAEPGSAMHAAIARLREPAPSARPTDLAAWTRELRAAPGETALQPDAAVESLPERDAPPIVEGPVDAPPSDAPRVDAPPVDVPREPVPPPIRSTPPDERSRTWLIAVPLAVVGFAMLGAIGFLFSLGLGKARTPSTAPPSSTIAVPSTTSDGGAGDAAGAATDAAPPSDAGNDAGATTSSDAGTTSRSAITIVPNGGGASEADRHAAIPVSRDAPIWGPAGALVTLVVFGDLECPHTHAIYPTLLRLKQAFGDELRLVWYDRPIPEHAHAEGAARWVQALRATSGSAAAWRLIGAALSDEAAPDATALQRWTTRIGADLRAVEGRAATVSESLSAERVLAGRYDIRRTPTLYVNGLRIEGAVDAARLALVVRHEIGAGASLVAAGAARTDVYARRVAKNLIGLGPDVPERACVPVAASPVRGASAPLVTVVEFCDYESEGCRHLEPTLQSIAKHHPADVRLVWKGVTLEDHPGDAAAERLALAARSAHGEAGFWSVHDRLLSVRAPLDSTVLSSIATDAGLDASKVLAEPGGHAPPGPNDVLADRLGVNGVPTCFVNGRAIRCSGAAAEFERAVDAELTGARALVTSGFERARLDSLWCGMP